MRNLLLVVALAAMLGGCASFRPVAAGTPVITLATAEERAIRLGARVTLPAGDYVPDFASDDGTYYLAPSSVMVRSLGINAPMRGGLFVPDPAKKARKQAAWVQHAPSLITGGALGGSPAMEFYTLDEPIKYTVKK